MVEDYNLEMEEIIKEIKKNRAKRVVLQLPDGLKPSAIELVAALERKTKADVLVWAGSNFGGCDVPFYLRDLGVDLLINFGHSKISSK